MNPLTPYKKTYATTTTVPGITIGNKTMIWNILLKGIWTACIHKLKLHPTIPHIITVLNDNNNVLKKAADRLGLWNICL